MNIYARNGHKVIFANPTAGYKDDQRIAKQHLTVGHSYTIDYTDVGSWHTDVYLLEFPNRAFNSVMFEDT